MGDASVPSPTGTKPLPRRGHPYGCEANPWRVPAITSNSDLPKKDRVSSIWKSRVFHTVVGGHNTAPVCAPVSHEAS